MSPGAARADHRVLIIDDHVLFAESLELALSLEGYDVRRLELPAEGGSMATLRSLALRANPRTVLLDLDLGRFGDGINLIAPLARAHTNVVVLTASEDARPLGRVHASGGTQGAAQERVAAAGAGDGSPPAPGTPGHESARSSRACSTRGPASGRPTTTSVAGWTCSPRGSDRCWPH